MGRVLLVDDHELFRELLAVVLGRHAEVEELVHAGSFAEARQALEQANGLVDLAIVDLDMGEGDGVETIGEVFGAGSGIPVLALTVNRDAALRDRALEAGAGEVLTKAATEGEIIGAVRRLRGA